MEETAVRGESRRDAEAGAGHAHGRDADEVVCYRYVERRGARQAQEPGDLHPGSRHPLVGLNAWRFGPLFRRNTPTPHTPGDSLHAPEPCWSTASDFYCPKKV